MTRFPLGTFIVITLLAEAVQGQTTDDPHRLVCRDEQCRKARLYIRNHFCKTPPERLDGIEGCDIGDFKWPNLRVDKLADYRFDTGKDVPVGMQLGRPAPEIRELLMAELQKIGLPANPRGKTYFRVWKPRTEDWLMAEAYYFRWDNHYEFVRQVIAVFTPGLQMSVLREMPVKRVREDGVGLEDWDPIDFADVDADGKLDVILLGFEYENHWFEVFATKDDAWRMIFSGLGYWL